MSVLHPKILEGLNPPQREAVETIEGPLLILAGAGSGKTRVVTRRIANLIAHGARPWQILAITFTNKAAAEMKRRVETLVAETNFGAHVRVNDIWLSTFHSFCARLLRREAEALGYSKDFSIYDEEDASTLLKEIIKRLGLGEDKRYSPRNVRQMISNFKSQALRPEEIEENSFHERVVAQVYREYQAGLKKNSALDFDDLLSQAVALFRDHPTILERYRERFRYVLVDEYQDTNKCQYHLIQLLGQAHRNVCATGDPDQSIYAWRGADVRNILSFEKDFPEAKVVKLEQNYRSTQRILLAASSVIENNSERKKKDLWTENAEGQKLSFTIAGDEQLEGYEVARQVEQLSREGRRYNDMAVFYRTNAQSRAIETALIQAAIPYQLVGGTAFYERREIKDALAYLRLVVNTKDDVCFRRVINVPRRALGDSALETIQQQAAKNGTSLQETLDGPAAEMFISTFKPKPRQGLVQFARLIEKLRSMPPFPVQNVLTLMLDASGLRLSLMEAGETERVDNLEELVNAAAEYDKENDPAKFRLPEGPPPEPGAYDGMEEAAQRQASLSGFLENSALLAPTDSFDPDSDKVTLMTLHMAKGLEFPFVFLTGMEEGLLPMIRSQNVADPDVFYAREQTEDKKAVEEERRLVYVGITRAREKIFISRAQFRRRFGKGDITQPSRFLGEIPDKLLEISDRSQAMWSQSGNAPLCAPDAGPVIKRPSSGEPFAAFEREVAQKFGDSNEEPVRSSSRSSRRHDQALQTVVDRLLDVSESQEEPAFLDVGDRVKHPQFGLGTVESVSGSGLSAKVRVQFHSHGPKQLLLSLAKLERL